MGCLIDLAMGSWPIGGVVLGVGFVLGKVVRPLGWWRRWRQPSVPPYRFGVQIIDRATPVLVETAGRLGRLQRLR